MSVCDKCNDFVFHYLLDYSCRVFVSFLVFSRFCTILFAHSQKTVDFNRNVVVVGVENSFALVPCFPRGDFNALCSRPGLNLIPPSCSEWFPSVCAPFYRIFASGSGRLQSVFFLLYFAETVCFSLLLFVVTFVCSLSAKKEIARVTDLFKKVCTTKGTKQRG